MSAFYDQASLVVVPSGYKSGKIYAQKPLTTDGQLTFTRASTATRVNASGLIEEVASGLPRLDYLNSSCPRLLLEPQRTNLMLFSEQLNAASWSASTTTVTANAQISPDGYQNADVLAMSASQSRVSQVLSLGAGTYSVSVYAKAITGSGTARILVIIDGVSTDFIFTPTTSWARYSFTFTAATSVTAVQLRAQTFIGDLAFWGCQLEVGSYATSYIPTLSTSVTRVADAASKTGISSLIGQTEGTLFVEFTKQSAEVSERYIAVGDGTTANRIMIIGGTGTSIRGFISVAGAVQFDVSAGTAVGTHKVALAYKANDVVMYIDGVQGTIDTSVTIPAVANLYVGTHETGLTERLNGGLNQALLFTTRLTNAQLAELTTI
jgi:hypothetical protein